MYQVVFFLLYIFYLLFYSSFIVVVSFPLVMCVLHRMRYTKIKFELE